MGLVSFITPEKLLFDTFLYHLLILLHRAESQPRVESNTGTGAGSDGEGGEVRESLLYQAVQPYTPTAPGELALLQDDTVKVLKAGPQGWARAFNTRTRDSGFVPGKYLKMWIKAVLLAFCEHSVIFSVKRLIFCHNSLQ